MKMKFKRAMLSIRLKLFVALTTIALFGCGCGLIKHDVVLSYDPQKNVEKVDTPGTVKLGIEITDVRPVRDKVGYIMTNWGVKFAPIIAENNVVDVLKSGIKAELRNRGFELGNGSVQLLVELNKCYSDFGFDFFAIESTGVAQVVMNVHVEKPDNTSLYSKSITGQYTHAYLRLSGGGDAKIALDGALKSAVSQLFADSAFIESLLKAAAD